MKLQAMPNDELIRILDATERDAGSDSVEVGILRREVVRRMSTTKTIHLIENTTEEAANKGWTNYEVLKLINTLRFKPGDTVSSAVVEELCEGEEFECVFEKAGG